MAKTKDKKSPPSPVPASKQSTAASKPKKTSTNVGNGTGSSSTYGKSSDSRKQAKRRGAATATATAVATTKSALGRLVRLLLSVFKVFAVVTLLVALLVYSPGLLDIEPVRLEAMTSPRPFTGSLAPNNHLDKVEKLFRHYIVGPESIAFHNGDLYTGLHNGWIVRIKDDRTIEPILTVGDPECDTRWEERKCGRPLGLRFHRNGTLFFTDAYHGLYKADVQTGVATALYHSSEEVNGRRSKIVNDLAVSSDGEEVYFSDSSTRFYLDEGFYEVLESASSGRVMNYNVKTNLTTLIVDGLSFANGIQLSPDEDYLLISETTRQRVLKHYLRGKRKGETEVFIDNLPGTPDNIRSNGEGGYWIAIVTSNKGHRSSLSLVRSYPVVCKVIARFIDVIRVALRFTDAYAFRSAWLKTAVYKLSHMTSYTWLAPAYGLVLEVDGNGDIVSSLHSPAGSVVHISQVTRHGQHLYFGSPWNGYLGRLKL